MSDSDKDGGGFLARIGETVKNAVWVDDPPTSAPSKAKKATAAPPPPQVIPTPVPTYTPSASVTPFPGAVSPVLGQVAVEADAEALDTISKQVFVDIGGRPSLYLRFREMQEALGKAADPATVLNALRVADKTVTAAAILSDINAHLGLLDGATQTTEQQFAAAEQQMIGAKDQEIAALQAANQTAAAEIERHQKEMAERNGRIATLNQERAEADAAIARGKSRATVAQQTLRTQLANMQQLFSSL